MKNLLILILSVTLLLGACCSTGPSDKEPMQYKYEIGDIVYYKLDSVKCIITDRTFNLSNEIYYDVQVKTSDGYQDYSVKEDLLFIIKETKEFKKESSSYTERLINGN